MTPEEALKKYDPAAIDAALAIYFQIKKNEGGLDAKSSKENNIHRQ